MGTGENLGRVLMKRWDVVKAQTWTKEFSPAVEQGDTDTTIQHQPKALLEPASHHAWCLGNPKHLRKCLSHFQNIMTKILQCLGL